MPETLTNIAQIYGITLLGYIAVKANWFDKKSTDGLLKFVFNFSLPPLLFRSLANAELPDHPPAGLLLSYYLGVFAILIAGLLISRYGFRHSPPQQVIVGFAGCFSNTVLLGIPIILHIFGESGELPLFILISFHGLTVFSLITIFLELSSNPAERQIKETIWWGIKNVFKNPIIGGILCGILFNLADLPYPVLLDPVLKLLSQTAIPCSLFGLGALLAGYKITGNIRLSMVTLLFKNILHPIIVWILAVQVFDVATLWANVAVMLAAMPTGASVMLFAHRYQQGIEIATTSIFFSTVASIFTITILLFILERV